MQLVADGPCTILLTNQQNPAHNGLYVLTSSHDGVRFERVKEADDAPIVAEWPDLPEEHAPTTAELFGPDFKKCPACRLIVGHPGPCASS